MVDPEQIEALLAEMESDTAPLSKGLRSAILEDAAGVAAASAPASVPWWRRSSLWGGALGVPLAALCGVWLGITQPTLVLQAVPGLTVSTEELISDDLFDDIYGTSWEEWL